jgi:hypothetical protein
LSASSASRCFAWQSKEQAQPPAAQVSRPPLAAPQASSSWLREVPARKLAGVKRVQ